MQSKENDFIVDNQEDLFEGTAEEKLDHILLNIQENFLLIRNSFQGQMEEKDRLIEKLYEELAGYREDKTSQYIRQILKEVIAVNKNIKLQLSSERWQKKTAKELLEEFRYLAEDIDDLLERFDVECYETPPGEPFDGKIHKVQSMIQVSEPKLDKTVAESAACGYREGRRILLPEAVVVYTCKE